MTTGDFDPNIPYGQPQGPPYGGQPQRPPYGQPEGPPYGQPQGYPNMPYGQPGSYPPAQPPLRGQAPGGLGYPPPQPPVSGQQPGGLGVRFLARLIDGILVVIISLLLPVLLGANSHDATNNVLFGSLFSGLLTFAYFVGFETTQGWTLGKKLFGLAVRGPAGAPKPNFKQSSIRNSFTLLPIIPWIGGLLAFAAWIAIAVTISSSPTKQGKHDTLAGGTQVVRG